MSYALFLDDLRDPASVHPDADVSFTVARTVEEARRIVRSSGCPRFISFDNDMGPGGEEGRDFARWLIDEVLDGRLELPDGFDFHTHSANLVAREAIDGLMENFLRHLGRR